VEDHWDDEHWRNLYVVGRTEAASSRNDLVFHKMEADQQWFVHFIEMACYCITDHFSKLFQVFTLSENRVTQGPRCIATLGRFFDNKNDFFVSHRLNPSIL
jgi:hypothetical protein